MSYVHGLGDAQERLAQEWDYKYGWIDTLEIKCPKCKSTNVEKEDWEEEYDEDWCLFIFSCFCGDCEHEFEHEHDM